ncbi:MAG: hypothetical protein ABI432_11970 [Flavobacteriales bacterium]
MRTFLRHLAVFSLLPMLVCIQAVMKADGTIDFAYLRFTTPQQSSLILGTSRAAQGLRPHVLDSMLNATGRRIRSYNYGFAVGFSNYGPAYYNSIRAKLDPAARDGVYVLSVDPWGLCCRADRPPSNDRSEDAASGIAKVHWVNVKPNLEYLIHNYNEPFLKILLPDPRPSDYARITDDGWVEVRTSMLAMDVERRTVKKVKFYREEMLPNARPSAMRLGYLGLTIDLLRQHGTVVLVRLPVSKGIQAIEEELWPGFSSMMQRMADDAHTQFIDLYSSGDEWSFFDGNHMTPPSSAKATVIVANALIRSNGTRPSQEQ